MSQSIALITGGSRGIGKATVIQFLKAGYFVIIASRNAPKGEDLKPYGNGFEWVKTDITSESQIIELFHHIENKYGTLDAVVNNAACLVHELCVDMTLECFESVMKTNVTSVFLCCREAMKLMKKQKGGSIVNISSLSGIRGVEKFPGLSAYVASKFAVVGLTESLSVEGRPDNIRVNAIAPGMVETDMLKTAFPDVTAETKPSDISESILFLSDPNRSAKITGAVLEIHCNN